MMNLAFILSFVTVSSAVAATVIQKSEPASVFKKGGDLEWSVITTGSKEFDTLHRTYQKNAEAERVLWLKENAVNAGSPAYNKEKRAFLQRRNLKHRQWVLEQTTGRTPGSTVLPVQKNVPRMPSVDLTPDTSMQERTFIGNHPSRRAIVRAAEDERVRHALTVGQ